MISHVPANQTSRCWQPTWCTWRQGLGGMASNIAASRRVHGSGLFRIPRHECQGLQTPLHRRAAKRDGLTPFNQIYLLRLQQLLGTACKL